ncbi:Peptidyl-arginine deiminase Porphyromonas-type [Penicillium cf. griseofulvum]|uniref:Peptidyl-arginine deiminase Porphyromonas-type n=1 Tax=Penicillium cf. griseofulvum TaxID=2972120 RepID=A0A9W9M487_9EURO|nr:Peptidyl-arginine deiminase Porphyromonas-type [Penicillium cf. griseofulvum]KAJ5434846.1 Peptidyl-arginine deiminase Porphyromonas-type [Penicillium cf. griseofulvum]
MSVGIPAIANMASSSLKGRFFLPQETARHAATILGFPSQVSIASAYYESACVDIANLASVISTHEPVRLFTRPEDVHKAKSMVSQAITKYPSIISNISVIPFPTNHLWVRDTGPVYVRGVGESIKQLFAINFRFSEWGRKHDIAHHQRASDGLDDWPVMIPEHIEENTNFARRVVLADASPSPVTLVESQICLEGGALVVDGEGTLLATESSIINENRNPGLSKIAIETELRRLLGVEKIIWFPGRKDLDVTDVHVDAEINFIRPGVVVLSRPHSSVPRPWLEVYEEIRDILGQSVDAKGRSFEVHIVDEPNPKVFGVLSYSDPATNYVNFYFVNGGLILPQFGDIRRDQEALVLFQKLCPDRVVQPVFVSALPLAGGVIHCATQPVLSVECE